jgi:hypothetical protein
MVELNAFAFNYQLFLNAASSEKKHDRILSRGQSKILISVFVCQLTT